jgi:uncharacterized protein YcaQ
MSLRRLDRARARQIAVRAQWLDAERPVDLVELVDQLTLLQIDPTKAIAPNADLVAWSRLGAAYEPTDLTHALEVDRTLFEIRSYVRPATALALHVPEAEGFTRSDRVGAWLEANDRFRHEVVARLRDSGPLLSSELPDTSQVPWASTGWTNDRNVTQMLELLSARGEVAVSARRGRHRLWDAAERVYPSFEPLPVDQARRRRAERRLQSLGVARVRSVVLPGEPVTVGEVGVPVTIDGVDGEWRADPDALEQPFVGRTALLSPFDRLVYDRERSQQLFDFEYVLEMYKPAAKRRWGYFALPVLHHDRLVGKLDAKADRRSGNLNVAALHEDVPFSAAVRDDVDAEIESLAEWLGLAVRWA